MTYQFLRHNRNRADHAFGFRETVLDAIVLNDSWLIERVRNSFARIKILVQLIAECDIVFFRSKINPRDLGSNGYRNILGTKIIIVRFDLDLLHA